MDKVLIICDYFTKWAEAYPIETQSAQETVDSCLVDFFARFGVPRQFHSDQGGNFRANVTKETLKLLGVSKTQTTPYHAQSDGLVERFNRTLVGMLRCLVNEHRDDWMDLLPLVMMAYRATPHASTKVTPNRMMLGREVTTPLDLQFPNNPPSHEAECATEYTEWLRTALRMAHGIARSNLGTAARYQRHTYDKATLKPKFRDGDLVKLWNSRMVVDKLAPRWTGPFRVLEVLSGCTFKIENPATGATQRVHANNLSGYKGVLMEEPT